MRRTQLKDPARTLCPGDYPMPSAVVPSVAPVPADVPTGTVVRAAGRRRRSPLALRLARRLAVAAALATALLVPLGGCGSTYTLPDRETPVEVWVEAPAAATAPFETHLLVYVGDRKAVDGAVRLAAGEVRRRVATLTMRGGKQDVSVVMGGRAVATENVKIEHRGWIVITIAGDGAKIASVDREPGSAR